MTTTSVLAGERLDGPPTPAVAASAGWPRWAPRSEWLVIGALGLFGFVLGARAIGDNSMFVHLRTGADIARTGAIPRTDPYSFTALGHGWVVQSWLAEWTYGWAQRLGGLHLVIVEQAVLMGTLAVLVTLLARAGSAPRTAVAGCLAVGVGAAWWAPRPLLFGLVALALVVLVVERRRSPWWLVPIMWVWVSSHGSFPLAVVWVALRGLGEAVDRGGWPAQSARYTLGMAAGLVAAAANPLGPKLLTFPFTLGSKRDVFRTIVEWRSPNFQTVGGIVTLTAVVLVVVLLSRRAMTWADSLPVVGFLALGLVAQRNLPLAAIVMAPALARALDVEAGAMVQPSTVASTRNVVLGVMLVLLMAVTTASVFSGPALDLRSYPVSAVQFLDRTGLRAGPHRVAEEDTVGCYLDLRYGPSARVFIDDRYDTFPLRVSEDSVDLVGGKADSLAILDRRKIDVVLWEKTLPLVSILQATGAWSTVFDQGNWVVMRRPAV